ncbi:hypothetical protein [Aeromicrobium sp.]|uniref:hypothetical protein n=1 Tax=Aeromicrobium sp. TaxID=1871063 RepID=UPI0028AF03A4|nr:hypothetical protein [Aeromicrobium sp.]
MELLQDAWPHLVASGTYVLTFLAGGGLVFFVAPKAERGRALREHRRKAYEDFSQCLVEALGVVDTHMAFSRQVLDHDAYTPLVPRLFTGLARVHVAGCSDDKHAVFRDAIFTFVHWAEIGMDPDDGLPDPKVHGDCIEVLVKALETTSALLKKV